MEQGIAAITTAEAISNSSLVNIAAGTTLDVRNIPGGYTVSSGQALAGSGTTLGSVTFGRGSTLSPGLSSAVSGGAMMSSAALFAAPETVAVPEPTALGLISVVGGFVGLGVVHRRRGGLHHA